MREGEVVVAEACLRDPEFRSAASADVWAGGRRLMTSCAELSTPIRSPRVPSGATALGGRGDRGPSTSIYVTPVAACSP
jgi:hypothetical protein